ncbi:unnamed protein product [Toxocara canis]|uniref:Translation initiation factor IF-2 n=1 Tax=Toxocara canis TaxID=6265 RepID=A0A183V326_TOXCA|nr:unnamed protein product [Toxocara canis]
MISVYKRNNEYGDEVAPPAPAGGAAEPAPAPAEEAPAAVEQAAAAPEAAPEVQASGYRRKRNNQYGDEVAPPAPAEGAAEPAPAPAEEAPAAVEQAAAAPEAAPEVQASGYRRKRNNEYGDEVAPPAPAEGGEEPAPAPAEEAPAAVEQAAAAPESAPEVQASGY